MFSFNFMSRNLNFYYYLQSVIIFTVHVTCYEKPGNGNYSVLLWRTYCYLVSSYKLSCFYFEFLQKKKLLYALCSRCLVLNCSIADCCLDYLVAIATARCYAHSATLWTLPSRVICTIASTHIVQLKTHGHVFRETTCAAHSTQNSSVLMT